LGVGIGRDMTAEDLVACDDVGSSAGIGITVPHLQRPFFPASCGVQGYSLPQDGQLNVSSCAITSLLKLKHPMCVER
jgi:hypothetical protein